MKITTSECTIETLSDSKININPGSSLSAYKNSNIKRDNAEPFSHIEKMNIPYEMSKESLMVIKDNKSYSKALITSDGRSCSTCAPCTSTVCRTVSSLPASLRDLPMNRDTRRARSEPGIFSSSGTATNQIVISPPPPTATTVMRTSSTTQGRSSAATARISSLDGLDSLGVLSDTTTRSSNNGPRTNDNQISSPVFASPVNQLVPVNNKSWDNNSAENESSDYVVDSVQGNAYHKGQFLGKGGFARVYLMTDIANGKKYACKIIPKNRMQKIHIQKIAREIMIHKDLNHINVVQMHHYFEDSLNVYMLLEACPRKSLMHVLKYRGKITEPEARYYMKQMVTGVAYIHSQKVVHRDLKPGNMFLSDGMIVKIGDFGMATRPDGQRRRVTVCGTPNYIAPEVLYKQAHSYEADVWALGCILYALLAGQPPFDTATLKETYSRICNNSYKKLDDSIVSCSGQDLIHWLLQPLPELRPSLERVKEHPYLTMEYVPTKLAHSCCYRMPTLHSPLIDNNVKSSLLAPCSTLPSGSSLSSASSRSSTFQRSPTGAVPLPTLANVPHIESKPKSIAAIATVKPITPQSQKETQKKSKVGHWLVRKFPKLTKLRHRIGNFLYPDRKKSSESAMMHRALEHCLTEIRYNRTTCNPLPVDGVAPLFITKWIDYSNKYGLCFQLSDRSVGVLFNDSSKMSYTRDRRRVEYTTPDDEVTRYARERDVPTFMHEKLELLRHFTEYMDDHLTNGGEIGDSTTKLSRRNSSSVPRMRRWLRTDKAIAMELTVPLLQVNFFVDHTKIVVSEGARTRDYLVTYIDADRHATSYWLRDLRDCGCTSELYERLNYVCRASREFAHLEHNAACSEISANRAINSRA
ncbi:serine/threonine-protein kinase PLK3 [Microplitis demolitor]|uniref:serine/threonine-protein kinase PLK3 n=1 Tax=Microplitis demolitor TaxID=69319 RepID=UPI0004CCF358|nr:serine/threonine-protein kinase PLK3 [Microplitis demolitor]